MKYFGLKSKEKEKEKKLLYSESLLYHKFVEDNSILSVWINDKIQSNRLLTTALSKFQELSNFDKYPYDQMIQGSKLLIKDQPIGAIGSALAISPHILITAGHLLDERMGLPYKRIVYVSGFRAENQYANIFRSFKVIDCKINHNLDYAIVELNEPVKSSFHQLTTRTSQIKVGTNVYVCGNACGMPLTRGEFTVKLVDENVFTLNRGTWLKLSGGVVFNSKTNEVEGIVIDVNDNDELRCLDISKIPLPKNLF